MRNRELGLPILKLVIRVEPDVVTARQKARSLAQLLGFEHQDQVRIATAVSELARNVYQYAGTGTVEFLFAEIPSQTFFVRVADNGPGIPFLEDIWNGVYKSREGMGVGLIGTKRLMDHFDIQAQAGEGVTVIIGKNLPPKSRKVTSADIRVLTDKLIQNPIVSSPFEEMQNQNRELMTALEETRKAQEEAAELNRELAETNRGVVALYAELDEKAESLQRANEVKTSFLSNMTHEFRTPLSSVISLTRLLLNQMDGDLTAEQVKQVNYIRHASEGLLELVNDLLDLAKVEAGKVSVNAEEFAVEEVLGSLRGMFRPIVGSNSDLALEIVPCDLSLNMKTDQGKLAQILRNLLSNAIKFTPLGQITVTTRSIGDLVHFSVSDTGVGIESQHLETIFEDFSQLDSPLQNKQKGTGLGLPLSRKLARLLGGDLRVESIKGEGSTFHVAIPRFYSGEKEAVLFGQDADKNLAADAYDKTRFRILVVDDDEPSRYVLKSLIRDEVEADFIEVDSGLKGLERIRQWRPDIVFLDLTMPGRSGLEILTEVHGDQNLKDIPVVVNTAKKLSPEESEVLSRMAVAVLSKDRTNHGQAISDLKSALGKAGFDYKERQAEL